jgi:uncharacterized protein YjbJ (UPF0337 family)
MMNKDQVKGRIREAKGTVKEAAGGCGARAQQKGKRKSGCRFQAGYGDIKKTSRMRSEKGKYLDL